MVNIFSNSRIKRNILKRADIKGLENSTHLIYFLFNILI